jgi:hypothetical protein
VIEFQEWPKIPRLNRDITITEKIDGTNAAVGILTGNEADTAGLGEDASKGRYLARTVNGTFVYAQSRSRIITPDQDNKGFAKWVWNHAEELASILGPGLHFGEWWGNGIQRGYGLDQGDKRFSLFNTKRWGPANEHGLQSMADDGIGYVEGLGVVPVLYEGPFDDGWVVPPWNDALYDLATDGSKAAPGFIRPEGVVIYHHAANSCFKVTLEHDDAPKGAA